MRSDVPIPDLLLDRPRDPRGYPIPATAYVDAEGRAHFQVLDPRRVATVLNRRCCGLCGKPHHRGLWFVGGPAEAFGTLPYHDPPMHWLCAAYALQVCPWLAMPSYTKRLDGRTLSDADRAKNVVADLPDARPPFLVAGMTTAYTMQPGRAGPVITPQMPWWQVRYWKDGAPLGEADVKRLTSEPPKDTTS